MDHQEAKQMAAMIRQQTHNLNVQMFRKGDHFYLMLGVVLHDPRDKGPLHWWINTPKDWVNVKRELLESKH